MNEVIEALKQMPTNKHAGIINRIVPKELLPSFLMNMLHEQGYEPLELLSQAGVDVSIIEQSEVYNMIVAGLINDNKVKEIEFLCRHNINLSKAIVNDQTILGLAVILNKIEIIDLFHRLDLDLNALSGIYTPLALAVANKNLVMVQRLIEYQVDLNKGWIREGQTKTEEHTKPAYIAASNGCGDELNLLLEQGLDPDELYTYGVPCTLAYSAAAKGHVNVLQVLLKHNATLEAASHNGGTPAHIAAFKGHLDVLEELEKNNFDFSIRDFERKTALEHAIECNQADCVLFLKKHEKQADIDLRHFKNLILLLQSNPSKSIEYLEENDLKSDMSFNIEVPGYDKPLIVPLLVLMVQYNYQDGIKFLINRESSLLLQEFRVEEPISKTKLSFPILDLFLNKNMPEVVRFLIIKGADPKALCDSELGKVEVWQHCALQGDYETLSIILDNCDHINFDSKVGGFPIEELLSNKTEGAKNFLAGCYNNLKLNKKESVKQLRDLIVTELSQLDKKLPTCRWFASLPEVYTQLIELYEIIIQEEKSSIEQMAQKLEQANSGHIFNGWIKTINPNLEANLVSIRSILSANTETMFMLRGMYHISSLLKGNPTKEQMDCLQVIKNSKEVRQRQSTQATYSSLFPTVAPPQIDTTIADNNDEGVCVCKIS